MNYLEQPVIERLQCPWTPFHYYVEQLTSESTSIGGVNVLKWMTNRKTLDALPRRQLSKTHQEIRMKTVSSIHYCVYLVTKLPFYASFQIRYTGCNEASGFEA